MKRIEMNLLNSEYNKPKILFKIRKFRKIKAKF